MSHAIRWVLGIGAAAALLLGIATPAVTAAPKPADTVMRKGFVYTVDKRNSVKQALAIRNGKLVYVGTNQKANRYIGKRTEVINLRGRMVMPGIVDAHNHAIGGGAALASCDLHYAALTVPEFLQEIQACLDETSEKEPDGWLNVSGWYRQAMRPEGTEVTKADLDTLTTDRPIAVDSSDGHSLLANSRALDLAGITAATPDPAGGHIGRMEGSMEPNGILEDSAQSLVASLLPPPTPADLLEWADTATEAMSADGVTSFMYQIANRPGMNAFRKLARSGELTARASLAPDISLAQSKHPKAAVRRILKLRREYNRPLRPRPNLTLRNVGELMQDGVIQWPAQTASLFRPYLENVGTEEDPDWQPSDWRGPDPYMPLKDLKPLVLALAKAGIEPEIHAIGDRAVHHTLNAYAYVRRELKKIRLRRLGKCVRIRGVVKRKKCRRAANRKVRLLIAHAEMVIPRDYARFRKLDVVPAMGFWWASPDFDSIDAAKDFLGPVRFNRMEPEGYLQRAGAKIALGSDWPVNALDSMYQLKVLVTREGNNPGEKYQGRLGTVPPVPIKPAIRAMTINPAYGMHMDHKTGSLEKGKFADLIVLSKNLLQIPPRKIAETEILRTVVGGRTVYEAD